MLLIGNKEQVIQVRKVISIFMKIAFYKSSYLRGSASVPSFGLLFGLLALGHPDRLWKNRNVHDISI